MEPLAVLIHHQTAQNTKFPRDPTSLKAAGCIEPYVDGPDGKHFFGERLDRLQPYVRTVCAEA
jgi:hypothetical protein